MQNGTRPTKIDHRDFDYHKSFGSVVPPTFPTSFSTDPGTIMPNQNAVDTAYEPPVMPQPEGCTNEATAKLATNLTNGTVIYRPDVLELITHANANGGSDLRTSLSAAVRSGWINAYFNIQAFQLDFFDSFRLAQISGIPEMRSISWGTPWAPSWEAAFNAGVGIMPMPTQDEIIAIHQQVGTFGALHKIHHWVRHKLFGGIGIIPWHDSELEGYLPINGVVVYRDLSWQGTQGGDHGYAYFTREVINTIMAIPGTVAYTATRGKLPPIATISVSLYEWLISNLSILRLFSY